MSCVAPVSVVSRLLFLRVYIPVGRNAGFTLDPRMDVTSVPLTLDHYTEYNVQLLLPLLCLFHTHSHSGPLDLSVFGAFAPTLQLSYYLFFSFFSFLSTFETQPCKKPDVYFQQLSFLSSLIAQVFFSCFFFFFKPFTIFPLLYR